MTEVQPKKSIEQLRSEMAELRAKKAMKQTKVVGKTVMADVDLYIKLTQERKLLEATIEEYKASIKAVMQEKEVKELYGKSGRSVYLMPVDKVAITGNFTAYDADDIDEFIPFEYKDLVFKTVVDRDVLESLVKTGKIDSTILELKLTESSEQLRVR